MCKFNLLSLLLIKNIFKKFILKYGRQQLGQISLVQFLTLQSDITSNPINIYKFCFKYPGPMSLDPTLWIPTFNPVNLGVELDLSTCPSRTSVWFFKPIFNIKYI